MADAGLAASLAANLTPEEWQRAPLASMQPERSPTRVVVKAGCAGARKMSENRPFRFIFVDVRDGSKCETLTLSTHNRSALTPIADVAADMDFRRDRP